MASWRMACSGSQRLALRHGSAALCRPQIAVSGASGSVRLMMQVLPKALRPGAGGVVMGAILAAAIAAGPVSAGAAEIAPHHALYSMRLGSTHGDTAVTPPAGTRA